MVVLIPEVLCFKTKRGMNKILSRIDQVSMKRFFVFSALFPPLALLFYVAPLLISEGVPKVDFLFTLVGLAYVFALIPALVVAGADWLLSAKPFHVIATMAFAAVMAHLLARYFGNPMDHQEIILVTLTGAIPAAVCSWLSGRFQQDVGTQ